MNSPSSFAVGSWWAFGFYLHVPSNSFGLGAEAKGSWGRPCLSGLLAQTRAGQLGLRCLGSRSEGLGHVGPIHTMRRTRLLVGEGLRLGPGQGGLGWALLGRVAGWAGLKPVLGGLGCGLLTRVAHKPASPGWAGPQASLRHIR